MPARFDPDAIGFLITDVARLLRAEFDRRTVNAGLGLTPGDARTLVNAARAGGVRQTVLAERMGVEAMTLSAYLDRLEAHDLVRRVPDPSDRRAKLVEVTEAAQPVLEEISRIGTELRTDISVSLAPKQLEEIRDGLKTMRTTLAGMRPDFGKGSSST